MPLFGQVKNILPLVAHMMDSEGDVPVVWITVKECLHIAEPLLFGCPLFRKFREPNKTAELKGNSIATLLGIGVENLRLDRH